MQMLCLPQVYSTRGDTPSGKICNWDAELRGSYALEVTGESHVACLFPLLAVGPQVNRLASQCLRFRIIQMRM